MKFSNYLFRRAVQQATIINRVNSTNNATADDVQKTNSKIFLLLPDELPVDSVVVVIKDDVEVTLALTNVVRRTVVFVEFNDG